MPDMREYKYYTLPSGDYIGICDEFWWVGMYQQFKTNGSRDFIDQNRSGLEHGPKIEFTYERVQKI
jgi:hypothetical protein